MGSLSQRTQALAGIILLPFLAWGTAQLRPLPAEMNRLILEGTRLVYSEEFKAASAKFRKITKNWPDHPAGPFFQAATIDAEMYHYGTDRRQQDFFERCDRAVRLGEKRTLRDPGDLWSAFFVGGAHGYKGTFEARYKRWISAFRNGFEGISVLKKIAEKNPGFPDLGLGIGTYYYWRSKLMKTLWWMPGVEDRREEGIGLLRRTMESGIYTKEGAGRTLIDIYIEEKRYADGLVIAERMLAQYPHCRVFLWGQGSCLLSMKRYDRAEKVYRYILDTVEADEQDNHLYAIACRARLARIYYERKIYYRALAECRRAMGYTLSAKVKEHAKDYLDEVASLLSKSKAKARIQKR